MLDEKIKLFRSLSCVLCCGLILIIFSNTCSSSESSRESEFIENELQRTMDESSALAQEWNDIMGIGLSNGKTQTVHNTVYLEDESDSLFLIIDFANGSKAEYVLKIFVDYIETEFQIDLNTYKEYYFSAEATDGFSLKFHLPEDRIDLEQAHIITVAMFKNPRLHQNSISTERDSYSLDFTLASAQKNSEYKPNVSYNQPAAYFNIPFSGIMLNCDMELRDNKEVFFPPATLHAAPSETVTLAYRAAGYDDSDSLLFMLLLDWEQVEINGYPYLFTENQYLRTNCGYIEFKAPDTPGEYELIALMSGNPFELRTEKNCWLNFTSTRFTLNVTNDS